MNDVKSIENFNSTDLNENTQTQTKVEAPKEGVGFSWRMMCGFFLHQPTLPKALRDMDE